MKILDGGPAGFFGKALELGEKDDENPGPWGSKGFYGGCFCDLDGNKLNVYVPVKSGF